MSRRRSRFSAQLNFHDATYGPLALRPLLRQRLLPGERPVGWGAYSGEIPLYAVVTAVALAMIPFGHFLGGLAGRAEKGVLVLTDRRILILASDATGPRPGGRGVRADWGLESVSVTARTGPRERLIATAKRRARGRPAASWPRSGAGTPSRWPALPAAGEPDRLVARASMFIIAGPDGRSFTVKLPYFSGSTACARLREGLVLLAGGKIAEEQREP